MKYTQLHDGIEAAKQATLYSPVTVLVRENGESKVLLKSTGTLDEELEIKGDTLDDLTVEKKQTGPEVVDLGLSVQWMKCNLGAESETDYGLYYDWGNIEGHDGTFSDGYNFDSSTYATTPGGQYTGEVLDAEHDAVTAAYGDGYRIPTKTEFEELLTLTNEWTTVSGIKGRLFHGKDSGEGNTLFIPAAGLCDDGSRLGVGSTGRVWSSSLYEGDANLAWYLDSGSWSANVYNCNRGWGIPLRGVCE